MVIGWAKKIFKRSPRFPGLKFRNIDLFNEFIDSERTDPRVRALAFELAFIAYQNDSYLEVTQIGRSKKSQVRIYGYDRKSGHREKPSRAIDFSVKNLSDKKILKLTNHFEAFLDLGLFWSLIHHDVNHGDHLHLQVPHDSYNKILWEKNLS